jgi:hypothetical protein
MKIVGGHLVGTICLVGNGVSIVSLVHKLGGTNKVVLYAYAHSALRRYK